MAFIRRSHHWAVVVAVSRYPTERGLYICRVKISPRLALLLSRFAFTFESVYETWRVAHIMWLRSCCLIHEMLIVSENVMNLHVLFILKVRGLIYANCALSSFITSDETYFIFSPLAPHLLKQYPISCSQKLLIC